MASPFRHFRKHQKTFFAVAAVLAIGLFVFGSGTGGGRSPEDEQQRRRASATVATWNGGSLTEGELASLTYQRQVTDEFLQKLFVTGGGQTQYDLSTNVPNLLLPNSSRQAIELAVINSAVFADLAEAAGISVSDEMVNHYIEEFGLNRVSSQDVVGLLATTGDGNAAANEAIVFGTLKKLLMAYFYQRAYDDAAYTVLPEQKWEDWRQVNERISLEAAILPTEKFLAEVPEPTDAQLQTLYEQYKEFDPDRYDQVEWRELPSPEPGFAVPRRIKLQYLVGNLTERTKKLLDSVTDAEIADYYERNKRTEFTKTSLDAAEDFDNDFPADEGEADAVPAAEDSGEAAPATESESAAEAPAATDAAPADVVPAEGATTEPSADAAPAGEPAAAEATTGSDAGPEAPAGEGSAPAADAAPTESSEGGPAEGTESSTRRRSPFQLTALQAAADDSAAAAPVETPADASAASVEEATTTEGAAEEPAESETEPAAETAADAAAETTNAASDAGASEAATPPDGATTTDSTTTDAASTDDKPAEFLPLDEVRDEIRETLARGKAVLELERQLSEARLKLQREYHSYGRKVIVNRESKAEAPPVPEKLKSLQWLADEYGLELVAPEALTIRELVETPVGQAVDEQSGRVTVAAAAYRTLELYEPFLARDPMDLGGDWYLVMKVEDSPHSVPPLAEVRDKVAAAWKQGEAAKLAEAKAKELAKELATSTEPFAEFFKQRGYEVVPKTALFSWRNFPLGPGQGSPAQLSEVPELKNVDTNFMQTAFGLEENEAEGLLNHDHSAAYVIRLSERQYAPETLKKMFLEEIRNWMGQREMLGERYSRVRQSVDSKIAEMAGFKFDEEWQKRFEESAAQEN